MPDADLSTEFIYWRKFGFGELRAGHIPFWNPHVFSGVPFMGGFQAALFYPFNWIYLMLPLRTAINCEIVLPVFLLGLFTAAWLRRYRLHPLAVLLACTATMFGAPFFLHIYPGHLAPSMRWRGFLDPAYPGGAVRASDRKMGNYRHFCILDAISGGPSADPLQYPGNVPGLWIFAHCSGPVLRKQTLAALAIVGVAAITLLQRCSYGPD